MSAAGCSCRRFQRNHFLPNTRSSRPCWDHPIQCFSVLILVTASTRALFSRDEVSLTTPP
jgi:hypothetical protein